MKRSRFLGGSAIAAAATTVALPTPTGAHAALPPTTRTEKPAIRSLVLSGGGAYGAYEAGIIQALKDQHVAFDFVCGTSIGALNAAFFAAVGEPGLRSVWASIAGRKIIRYQPIVKAALWQSVHVGVGTRIYDAFHFLFGAFAGTYKSIYQSGAIKALLAEVLAPGGVHRPFSCDVLWTATDITRACSRAYVRHADPSKDASAISYGLLDKIRKAVSAEFSDVLPTDVETLPDVDYLELLRASSAMPFVFDPVPVTINGETFTLVDGGALNNTPVSLARLGGADEIWMILLGPRYTGSNGNANMMEILMTLYKTMSQRIQDDALIIGSVLASSDQRQRLAVPMLLTGATVPVMAATKAGNASLDRAMFSSQPKPVKLMVLTAGELAGNGLDFNDQCSIDTNYNAGYATVMADPEHHGFVEYALPTFDCATPMGARPFLANPCPPIQPPTL